MDEGIGGEKGEAGGEGLGHEKSVERVFVVERQRGEQSCGAFIERQFGDAVESATPRDVDVDRFGKLELLNGDLDRDLGDGHGAEEHSILR